MKMYPKRECHDCRHVVDIEEDITGRDLITCELDECEHCPCEEADAEADPVPFKRCPICGYQLTVEDLMFMDDEGTPIGEMDRVTDYENIADPKKNAMWAADRITAEENNDVEWMNRCETNYTGALDDVEYISLSCRCGFQFFLDADDVDFPENSWLSKLASKVNARWRGDE